MTNMLLLCLILHDKPTGYAAYKTLTVHKTQVRLRRKYLVLNVTKHILNNLNILFISRVTKVINFSKYFDRKTFRVRHADVAQKLVVKKQTAAVHNPLLFIQRRLFFFNQNVTACLTPIIA